MDNEYLRQWDIQEGRLTEYRENTVMVIERKYFST